MSAYANASSERKKPSIPWVVAIVLGLVVVQYYAYSLLAFHRDYTPLYRTRLQPELDAVPEAVVPVWSCTGACHPTPFNESQFHCEGCFQPSLIPTPERKKQVAAWEVRCNIINEYYEHDTFTMHPHDCDHSLVSLLLGKVLDAPSITVNSVHAFCYICIVGALAIQLLTISYGTWWWIEWKKQEELKEEERLKQEAKERAQQEIEGPSAALMHSVVGDMDGLRRRSVQLNPDLHGLNGPAFG